MSQCHSFSSNVAFHPSLQSFSDSPDSQVTGSVECQLCTSGSFRCDAAVKGGKSQLIAANINLAYNQDGAAGQGRELFMFCGDGSPGTILGPRGITYPTKCKPYDSNGESVNAGMVGEFIDTSMDLSSRLEDMAKNPHHYFFSFHSEDSWKHWQTTDDGRVGMARGVMALKSVAPESNLGPGIGGILAGVFGGVALLAGLLIAACLCWRRKHAAKDAGKKGEKTRKSADIEARAHGISAPPLPMLLTLPSPAGASSKEEGSPLGLHPSSRLSTSSMFEVPKSWVNRSLAEGFATLESLPPEQVIQVQDAINATFKQVRTRDRKEGRMPSKLVLKHALRIEHSGMWKRYLEFQQGIKDKRQRNCTPLSAMGGRVLTEAHGLASSSSLQKNVNEAYLWHGTSPAGALGIVENGFKLDLAGSSAGTMYGPGAYFAECSSKSDEYARDDEKGIYRHLYCLLLCRVTLGEVLHMTTGGEATHAMIKAALASGAYDSVLGNREASVGTYREFVAYDERQVYPEFVLLYTHHYDNLPESCTSTEAQTLGRSEESGAGTNCDFSHLMQHLTTTTADHSAVQGSGDADVRFRSTELLEPCRI
eukprot:gb/GFBE01061087.1/.p1 GENE.gb/GFBE01061087.1/~~gb/GFBE01061087.1/.p1  ORF type:complete len:593 (+),score=113.73 gb/GFBE01061087.1/:1-1779(+)